MWHMLGRGDKRGEPRFLSGNLKETDHLEDLGIDWGYYYNTC
jgi:hypothetical protein